jgi:hypothetical protein
LKKRRRTIRRMTTTNLAWRACYGHLTVEEVNGATKEKLEEDKYGACKVIYFASLKCPVEVIEAILDKNVNIDDQSTVSIVVVAAYY